MRIILALLPVLADAYAPHPPAVTATVAAMGSAIELTLTNQSLGQVRIPTVVVPGDNLVEGLTVDLIDAKATKRTLTADHAESPATYVKLDPGKSRSNIVDLQAWAVRAGAPIAPGTYTVHAKWDIFPVPEARVRLVVATKLTIAAPIEKACASPSTGSLELLVHRVESKPTIAVGLHNRGTTTLCVDAVIRADRLQSDWLTFATGDGANRQTIGFVAPRKKAQLVTVELAPGATTWATWDLVAWAEVDKLALPHGLTQAMVAYDASSVTTAWHGRITATIAVPFD